MTISKPGKSKQDLLNCLEKLKSEFSNEIEQYNVKITPNEDGYKIQGEKKVLFVNFSVDIGIVAKDGEFEIEYETNNVPKSKVNEALEQVKQVLKSC